MAAITDGQSGSRALAGPLLLAGLLMIGSATAPSPDSAAPQSAAQSAVSEPSAGAGTARTAAPRSEVVRRQIRVVDTPAGLFRARARVVVLYRHTTAAPTGTSIEVSARAARRGHAARVDRMGAVRLAVARASNKAAAAARRKAQRHHWRSAAQPLSAAPAAAAGGDGVFGLNVWDMASLERAEGRLGLQAGIVGVFADFAHSPDFPRDIAERVAARGASLLVAWEPWDSWAGGVDQPGYRLRAIVAGDHDQLIRRWARQVAGFGDKVLLRFAPEMNGDWRPWSPGVNGNRAPEYTAAWRRVVEIFRQEGARNAVWVWNPIVASGGSTELAQVYPGDSYVDLMALDGYNWGSARQWGWQSYDDVFGPSVAAISELGPGKPWFIAEVGCAPGPGKPAWIRELFTRAVADGARAVVWFEFDKETDWRLSRDPESIAAGVGAVASAGWTTAGGRNVIESTWPAAASTAR